MVSCLRESSGYFGYLLITRNVLKNNNTWSLYTEISVCLRLQGAAYGQNRQFWLLLVWLSIMELHIKEGLFLYSLHSPTPPTLFQLPFPTPDQHHSFPSVYIPYLSHTLSILPWLECILELMNLACLEGEWRGVWESLCVKLVYCTKVRFIFIAHPLLSLVPPTACMWPLEGVSQRKVALGL